MCGADVVQLHHKTYDRIGAEDLTDLTPLCARCHALIHVLERRGDITLSFDGFESIERAFAYRQAQARVLERAGQEFDETRGDPWWNDWLDHLNGDLDRLAAEALERGIDLHRQIASIKQRLVSTGRKIQRRSAG
jgi:hypothetical protein